MRTHHREYTIAEYCRQLGENQVSINRAYQRGSGVWPEAARAFLIETILMDYPIPKLSLHEVTDPKSRSTVKYVVDGQQRTAAINDFFEGKLRLKRTLELEEARGRRYTDLSAELQARFLNYTLGFDVFAGVEERDIREVFRRINSFTVPLNPEEQRHALYQGTFKWFIYRLARDYDTLFETLRTFTTKQIVRMSDAKLLTELSHALLFGIETTNKRKLDGLYRARDEDFPEEARLEEEIRDSLGVISEFESVSGSYLARPHMLYALVLAVAAGRQAVPTLQLAPLDRSIAGWTGTADGNLAVLAEAMELGEEASSEFSDFVNASSARTNVKEQRQKRVRWFTAALTNGE